MFVVEVQDRLEAKTLGGVFAHQILRAVLQQVAMLYFLLRSIKRDEVEKLGQTELGKLLLSLGASLDSLLGYEEPVYGWGNCVPFGTLEEREISEADVPAEILDKIREQAREEVLENLTDADVPDHIIVPLREQIKEEVLSEACELAINAANDELHNYENFDPFDLDNAIGFAVQDFQTLRSNFEALKEHIEREFVVLEANVEEVEGRLSDAKDEVPRDGYNFDRIRSEVESEINYVIERM